MRPTQGKTLAVMEVSGGSQSFNAVNELRVLGRWMRMKPSAYYDRVVDVMGALVKFTPLTRDVAPDRVDRYSERRESAEALTKRVDRRAIWKKRLTRG